MIKLYEIKELLTNIFKKYEKFIMPVLRFILAFVIVAKLNGFFNYAKALDKFSIQFGSAALAAFLPGSWFLLLLGAMVLFQVFSVSLEATIVLFVIMLAVYLLFMPMITEYSWIVILMPLLLHWNLGYLMPLILGLLFSPITLIPMSVGIGIFRFAGYLGGLLQMSTESGKTSMFDAPENLLAMYNHLIAVLTADRTSVLLMLVFSMALILVYYIAKVEMDYAHYIAIGVAAVFQMLTLIVGNILWKGYLNIGAIIVGLLFSALLAAAFQFMRFRLDYQQAQRLQFEDDHYYYYVKAIPKIKVNKSTKEIKRIK
ncbi:hypothetical protein EII17_05065 [Clostridiales bacterium COT073_COT-073]|nr:hypothetical protein EII17_05065 [Clostridiales bacterium COT073_COT-073]